MARKTNPAWFGAVSRRLWRDERGATLALVAVTITVLLIITGLAVDVGWWYTLQRQNQSAADAGAIAAAYELVNGNTDVANELTPAASHATSKNKYTGSTPAVTYPYGGNNNKVEVALSQVQNTWFASLTGLSSVTLPTRAVAMVQDLSTPCVYVLNPTADQALTVSGSATLSSPNCAICVASNSADSIFVQGGNNAVLQAETLSTAGAIDDSNGNPQLQLTYPAQLGANPCGDPWASVLTHSFLTSSMPTDPCALPIVDLVSNLITVSGTCSIANNLIDPPPPNNGATVVMSGNTVITGGWTIQNQTVDLAPGTYWITDGDLTLGSNSTLRCSTCVAGVTGVTIILTTLDSSNPHVVGNITQGANAVIESLYAPASGDFENLLLIQDSNGLPAGTTFTENCNDQGTWYSCSSFQGGAGHTFEGLGYFPETELTFQGTATGQNGCLLMVADTLIITGNGMTTTLASSGCPVGGPGGVAGGVEEPLKTVALVE